MRRLLDTLCALAIAAVMIALILPGLAPSAAAPHKDEHIHHGTASEMKRQAHLGLSTTFCHGALSCHAAVSPIPGDLSRPASVWRLRHRKHTNLLQHLAHPVFDPPPPRVAV